MASQIAYCDACKFDDALVEATCFCVSCIEYLCQMCCRDHKRNKATRSHTLLENEKMPTDIEPFQRLHKMTKCEIHPEYEIAYECVDHKSGICVACLSESHRKCEHIHDFALDSDETDVISFNDLLSRLEDITVLEENCSRSSAKEGKQIMTEVNAFRNKLKGYVDRITEKFLFDVKGILKSDEEKSKKANNKRKMIKANIDKGNNLLKLANEHCTKSQIGVVSKHLKDMKQKFREDIDSSIQQPLQYQLLKKKATDITHNCIREVQRLSKWVDSIENGSDAIPPTKDFGMQTDKEVLQVVLPAEECSDSVKTREMVKNADQIIKADNKKEVIHEPCTKGPEKEDTSAAPSPVELPKQDSATQTDPQQSGAPLTFNLLLNPAQQPCRQLASRCTNAFF